MSDICHTPEYAQMVYLGCMPILIITAILIPSLLIAKVYRSRKDLNSPTAEPILGVFYFEYVRRGAEFWELFSFVQRLIFVMLVSSAPTNSWKAVMGMASCFLNCFALAFVKPYVSNWLFLQETASACVLFLLFATVALADPPADYLIFVIHLVWYAMSILLTTCLLFCTANATSRKPRTKVIQANQETMQRKETQGVADTEDVQENVREDASNLFQNFPGFF